jgi:hypothetical protein
MITAKFTSGWTKRLALARILLVENYQAALGGNV